VQTLTRRNTTNPQFPIVTTGPTGQIIGWTIALFQESDGRLTGFIGTTTGPGAIVDSGSVLSPEPGFGVNEGQPGSWLIVTAVADTGSTLSMMTLILMALGVAARRFKRAAA
jgi:hypothetical protein